MTAAVLLDTSFLISLVDGKRANHSIAAQYFDQVAQAFARKFNWRKCFHHFK